MKIVNFNSKSRSATWACRSNRYLPTPPNSRTPSESKVPDIRVSTARGESSSDSAVSFLSLTNEYERIVDGAEPDHEPDHEASKKKDENPVLDELLVSIGAMMRDMLDRQSADLKLEIDEILIAVKELRQQQLRLKDRIDLVDDTMLRRHLAQDEVLREAKYSIVDAIQNDIVDKLDINIVQQLRSRLADFDNQVLGLKKAGRDINKAIRTANKHGHRAEGNFETTCKTIEEIKETKDDIKTAVDALERAVLHLHRRFVPSGLSPINED